ncbi:MAG: 2-amino-4-hydroxy-6-hydroxymethyldihydropteridine diphosphokinase [Candidatus Hydrogenedens sp.]|nr:2-amino-4-hydroxy-6-hydroxymethyldihydropteridine diphosphokinase [Candidatus Hydrogenedens sp.]
MNNNFVYIGVGSNINPEYNIPKSFQLLREYITIKNISPIFITPPLGSVKEQPLFANCVIEAMLKDEIYTPIEFKFCVLRKIESEMKRIRTENKYSPRTIDLDILLFKDEIINNCEITIPDPDIYDRNFLFAGLLYLNPNLVIYPENKSLINIYYRYEIERLRIDCHFTIKLWKEFLNEY